MSYSNYNHSQRRSKLAEPSQLLSAANLFTPTADQKYMLGAEYSTDDGRKFRYCKAAATVINKNLMIQGAVQDAQQFDNLQNVTSPTQTAGLTQFDIDIITASGIANGDLIDGYLIVNQSAAASGDDEAGDMYVIKNNKWTTSDTVLNITIADAGGLRNAITATSNITVIKNPCMDVITKPTTMTAPIVGASLVTVTASYYFWAQTKGPASVLIDTGDTILIGDPVGHIDSSGSAGSVGLVSTYATDPTMGKCMYAAAGADYGLINLSIE